jgi:hypothetical protein
VRGASLWVALMIGPDAGGSVETLAACGAEVDLRSCDAWWRLNYGAGNGACRRTGLSRCSELATDTFGSGPESCFPRGARSDGEVCGHGTQCASGVCFHDQAPGRACTNCAAAVDQAGDRCGDGIQCRGDLICRAPTCISLAQSGACPPHQVMFGGCKPRAEEGVACDPGTPFHQQVCAPDLLCHPETETCEPLEIVPEGERCGLRPDGSIARCALGTACKLSETPDVATCVRRIPLGDACTTGYLFGDGCEPPADCADGTCQLRGPALCPRSGATRRVTRGCRTTLSDRHDAPLPGDPRLDPGCWLCAPRLWRRPRRGRHLLRERGRVVVRRLDHHRHRHLVGGPRLERQRRRREHLRPGRRAHPRRGLRHLRRRGLLRRARRVR